MRFLRSNVFFIIVRTGANCLLLAHDFARNGEKSLVHKVVFTVLITIVDFIVYFVGNLDIREMLRVVIEDDTLCFYCGNKSN